MQGIYTCIPETIYVPREYSVAAIVVTIHGAYITSSLLLLLFTLICMGISGSMLVPEQMAYHDIRDNHVLA
jgi:hypothetical protein